MLQHSLCTVCGKDISSMPTQHKSEALFLWAIVSPQLSWRNTVCFTLRTKAESTVFNWRFPLLLSPCSLLNRMSLWLLFAVLLLGQGYFGWRDVHLLWSCPGLSTWSSDKCMYIYRMLRQNEALNWECFTRGFAERDPGSGCQVSA